MRLLKRIEFNIILFFFFETHFVTTKNKVLGIRKVEAGKSTVERHSQEILSECAR